jgi:Xaa-Pro aminopeptidase
MPSNLYAARRRRVMRQAVRDAKARIDAFLVNKVEDVAYLTGFTGDDSFALVLSGAACLLTDGRYDEQAHKECPGLDIFVRKGPMPQAVADVLKGRKVRRLAVQGDYLSIRLRDTLQQKLPKSVRIVPVGDVTGRLRQVKDDQEVRLIRKALAVAQGAFCGLISRGARAFVGRTEREVAAELDYRMRLAGADKPAFETIVAAGAHSSLPHYRPGSTRIRRDQPVLIDWGAFVGGYCCDLTRVVCVGKIPTKLAEVYKLVRRAQQAGMAALVAGASARKVDAAARKVIEDAGYGARFVHGLGHGIGRQIHEMPAVGQLAKGRLRAGMVVTVEPGVYLPGVGGIRIEDDVLVGPDDSRRLSGLAASLEAMTLR